MEKVQRLIVKDGQDAGSAQVADQRIARIGRRHDHVEEMVGRLAVLGHERHLHG